MSLLDELDRSQNTLIDCVRMAAVWVGHIDHDFSEEEQALILRGLPDREGGMPLSRIIQYVKAGLGGHGETESELADAFDYIKHHLSDKSKDAFLNLVVGIVAADGRISVGERHALAFLGDLCGDIPKLQSIFLAETGQTFGTPTDLSDPAVWDALEARQRQKSTQDQEREQQQERQRQQQEAPPTGERVEALAVLGLVGNPSFDDIKLAYRRLARIHHPDRYQALDAEAVAHATKTFQRIQWAYKYLEAAA